MKSVNEIYLFLTSPVSVIWFWKMRGMMPTVRYVMDWPPHLSGIIDGSFRHTLPWPEEWMRAWLCVMDIRDGDGGSMYRPISFLNVVHNHPMRDEIKSKILELLKYNTNDTVSVSFLREMKDIEWLLAYSWDNHSGMYDYIHLRAIHDGFETLSDFTFVEKDITYIGMYVASYVYTLVLKGHREKVVGDLLWQYQAHLPTKWMLDHPHLSDDERLLSHHLAVRDFFSYINASQDIVEYEIFD